MNYTYGSPGSFVSIVRSISVGHKNIQAEEVLSVQTHHQFMDQLKI